MMRARTFIAAFLALSITDSSAQTVKCTTWNLEWFPNGSPKQAPAEKQEQRIKEAADCYSDQYIGSLACDARVPFTLNPM